MIRALVLLALGSCSVALKLQKSETAQGSASCGVVLGGFGSQNYVNIARKVATHIRALEMPKGWCPEQPGLDKAPVTLFGDKADGVCPEGVNCLLEKDMAPWEGGDKSIGGQQSHLGSWKFRFYHAQMLINSPYNLTLYVDVDALPCTGEGVANFFKLAKEGVTLGSIKHEEHLGGGGGAPPGMKSEDHADWSKWPEHNAGVIYADLRVTKPMFEEWAEGIKRTAGHAAGDQFAYRQATFNHRKTFKEHFFNDLQVCRNLSGPKHNCKHGGEDGKPCWVYHKPGMRALKENGITR